MRTFGFILVAVGFLGGSLASVVSETQVDWRWLAVAVGVGMVGVILIRAGHKSETQAVEKLTFDMQTIEGCLKRIVGNITELNKQKQSVGTYGMRHRIDELFPSDLSAFVSARRSIVHIHGLAAYAEVMSDFAAGERYLNRVWSASADGYGDEVDVYLDKAREQFAASLDKVVRLQSQPRH
jgi:hypothetical protein